MPRPVLYFVRHGETDWNAAHRLQGQHDSALNANGRAQAARCGTILRDLLARDGRRPEELDYVASPLARARSSMELMREAIGLDPTQFRVDARLAEMSFGRWEGLTFAEVQARDPAALAARKGDRWNFAAPGGESYAQVLARVADWRAGVVGDSVVAAHLGTGRALLAHLGLAPPDEAARTRIEQDVIYVFADGGMTRYD
jgi:probable phosphoglycerate mutase